MVEIWLEYVAQEFLAQGIGLIDIEKISLLIGSTHPITGTVKPQIYIFTDYLTMFDSAWFCLTLFDYV